MSNPDLERAREAALTIEQKWPAYYNTQVYAAITRLILEQRAEEAERMIDVRSPYVPVVSLRERAADLRRQAGELEP